MLKNAVSGFEIGRIILESNKDKKRSSGKTHNTAQVLGLGVMVPGMIFGCIFVGSVLGYFLDQKFETLPWLTFIGLVFGIVAAVREVRKILKKINDEAS